MLISPRGIDLSSQTQRHFILMVSSMFPLVLSPMWCGVEWCGCGVVWVWVWSGVVWCGVVWSGVGVEWRCGVEVCGVWCGVHAGF